MRLDAREKQCIKNYALDDYLKGKGVDIKNNIIAMLMVWDKKGMKEKVSPEDMLEFTFRILKADDELLKYLRDNPTRSFPTGNSEDYDKKLNEYSKFIIQEIEKEW